METDKTQVKTKNGKGYIYAIQNDFDDNIYIGSTTKTPEQRFTEHKNTARKNPSTPIHLYMAMHGIEHFYVTSLKEVEFTCIKELEQKEKEVIKDYGKLNSVHNMFLFNNLNKNFGLDYTEKITTNKKNDIFLVDSNINEREIIKRFLKYHPIFKDLIKYCPKTDTVYYCPKKIGIWKILYPYEVESKLYDKIKKYTPDLSNEELCYIGKQCWIEYLRKTLYSFICDRSFKYYIDENRDVFSLRNYVYDIKQKKLRKPSPNDFIYTHTNWEYDEEIAEKYINDVENYFCQLFPIEKEKLIIVTFLASLLHGYRSSKNFIAITDNRNGNSGKSTLINLLRYFFGDYMQNINKFLLNRSYPIKMQYYDCCHSSDFKKNGINLPSLKGKRLLVYDELEYNTVFNESFIKSLSDGEYIVDNIKEKFQWQAGIILFFNNANIPKFDDFLGRRLITLKLRSKFVKTQEEIENITDDVDKNNTYLRDLSINGKFHLWKSALLKYFMKYTTKKGLQNLDIPESIKDWNNEVYDNEMHQWLLSIITEDKNGFVKYEDIYEKYKTTFPQLTEYSYCFSKTINTLFINKGIYGKKHYDEVKKKNCRIFLGYKLK